jgi:thiamine pyrophosphokinase
VLDSAMERVMKLNIKVDVLLGDFDRDFDANYYKEHQHPIEIVHTPDQNKTDLEKAFDYLYERKIAAVNVVWATGKRTGSYNNKPYQYCSLSRKIRDRDSRRPFESVYYLKIRKMVYSKHPISLIPIGHVTGIHSENLFYALQDESLTIGYHRQQPRRKRWSCDHRA